VSCFVVTGEIQIHTRYIIIDDGGVATARLSGIAHVRNTSTINTTSFINTPSNVTRAGCINVACASNRVAADTN
jgi:hypothetical protein